MNSIDIDSDLPIKLSIGTLWFCGVMYALIAIGSPIAFFGLFANFNLDFGAIAPEEMTIIIGTSVLSILVGLACAVGNFVVAWGLKRRKKWAWIATVIVGALYAPSICLPFGGLFLYAMLRSGVREALEQAA